MPCMDWLAATLACLLACLMGAPRGTLLEGDWEVACLTAAATCALLTFGAHWAVAAVPVALVAALL